MKQNFKIRFEHWHGNIDILPNFLSNNYPFWSTFALKLHKKYISSIKIKKPLCARVCLSPWAFNIIPLLPLTPNYPKLLPPWSAKTWPSPPGDQPLPPVGNGTCIAYSSAWKRLFKSCYFSWIANFAHLLTDFFFCTLSQIIKYLSKFKLLTKYGYFHIETLPAKLIGICLGLLRWHATVWVETDWSPVFSTKMGWWWKWTSTLDLFAKSLIRTSCLFRVYNIKPWREWLWKLLTQHLI